MPIIKAAYESNRDHLIIVRDNGVVSLIGASGRSLGYEYISHNELILDCLTDVPNPLEVLNSETFDIFHWHEVRLG